MGAVQTNERGKIRKPKLWQIAVIIPVIAMGGGLLIQFRTQYKLNLAEKDKIQSEKQQLERELEVKLKLIQAKDQEIQTLKLAKEQKAKYQAVSYKKYATPVSTSEAEALLWIQRHEGGATSVNRSSLACGLAQSLPCSKVLSYAGVDLSQYNLRTYAGVKAAISTVPASVQWEWMKQYIYRRYGSAVNAQRFWMAHGWY